MKLSKEELKLINEALCKVKALSETEGFRAEKRILDSYVTSSNENVNKLIQDMYSQLLQKIEREMTNE